MKMGTRTNTMQTVSSKVVPVEPQNSPTKDTDSRVSGFSELKAPASDNFTDKFYQTVKFQIIPVVHRILQRSKQRRYPLSSSFL